MSEEFTPLPKDPPQGLLESMAVRYDHGLGCEGYYDQPLYDSYPSHQEKWDSTLVTMRQLYEEVSGHGFYQWKKEDYEIDK